MPRDMRDIVSCRTLIYRPIKFWPDEADGVDLDQDLFLPRRRRDRLGLVFELLWSSRRIKTDNIHDLRHGVVQAISKRVTALNRAPFDIFGRTNLLHLYPTTLEYTHICFPRST